MCSKDFWDISTLNRLVCHCRICSSHGNTCLDALLIGHGPKRASPENSIRVVIAGVKVDLDID